MKKLVTHMNGDLDSFAIEAFSDVDPMDIMRIPAGAKSLPSGWEDAEVWDHPLGTKGDSQNCAFVLFCEAKGLDVAPAIISEVNEQDTTGKVVAPRFSLASIIAGLRSNGASDGDISFIMREILMGLNTLHGARREAKKIVSEAEVVTTQAGEKFIVLTGESGPMVGIVANEQGFTGAIYRDGHNQGVTRYPGRETPDLRRLQDAIAEQGWFYHPAGFLSCWGSRKSPATKRSRVSFTALKRHVAGL